MTSTFIDLCNATSVATVDLSGTSKWQNAVRNLMGKENLLFLEVGSLDPRLTCWLLQNVLTSKTASIICVDAMPSRSRSAQRAEYESDHLGEKYRHFIESIEHFGSDKVEVQIGDSINILSKLPSEIFDFVCINLPLDPQAALEHAVISFRLLKSKSLLVLTDMMTFEANPETQLFTNNGIEAFLTVFKERYELIHKDKQLILQKL